MEKVRMKRFGVLAMLLLPCMSVAMSYGDYLYRFQGMTEDELVAIWGQPTSIVDRSDQKFIDKNLTYTHHEYSYRMSSPTLYYGYGHRQYWGGYAIYPDYWRRVDLVCSTTFVIQDGSVIASYYEGNGCYVPPGAENFHWSLEEYENIPFPENDAH